MLRRLYIPFHLVILAPLLTLALPLALLALLTTALALLALLARLAVVYLDLALALLTNWIPPLLPSPTTTLKRRSRASTATSARPPLTAAATAIVPVAAAVAAAPSPRLSRRPSRSGSHASVVLGMGAPDRDYEGVGGWQLVDDDDAPAGLLDDADADADNGSNNSSYYYGGHGDDGGGGANSEEATWIGWNSRLELPASGGVLRRRLSATGSSAASVASVAPLQDRVRRGAAMARATSAGREDDGGYFGQVPGLKRRTSGIAMTSLDDDEVNHQDFSKI